jgi:hypothetical protein
MDVQTRVKERAEEQSTAMTAEQQSAIRTLADELHRLNHAVMRAVDAGVSVGWSARPATMAATATGVT